MVVNIKLQNKIKRPGRTGRKENSHIFLLHLQKVEALPRNIENYREGYGLLSCHGSYSYEN